MIKFPNAWERDQIIRSCSVGVARYHYNEVARKNPDDLKETTRKLEETHERTLKGKKH